MKKIGLLVLCLSLMMQYAHSQNRIEHNGEQKFFNGINLAWNAYAYDLVSFSDSAFTLALDSMQKSGCNTMRWWLFIDGTQSPQFDAGGKVSGISEKEIEAMKTALDMAMARGIGMVMCLWSFDLYKNTLTTTQKQRNKFLVENPAYTQAFIDKALNPIIQELGLHPAVTCWEVCNEPEGMSTEFGWTTQKSSMKYIQQFTNMIAGAIHRIDTNIKVSNGSLFIKPLTTVGGGIKNYYSDNELIAAGGDSLGTLDFYMAHFYADNNDTAFSPFLHPYAHWKLDKPLVIGEFTALGILKATDPIEKLITPTQAYKYLYDNGYAGALAWTYTNHDGNGGLADVAPAMQHLIDSTTDADLYTYTNTRPYTLKQFDVNAYKKGYREVKGYANLNDYFNDKESGKDLTYTIVSISDTSVLKATITNDSILNFVIAEGKAGISRINIQASDKGHLYNLTVRQSFPVFVYDTASEDRALYRKTWASTEENYHYYAEYAVDGNKRYPATWDKGGETRWSSAYTDNEFLIVELDSIYSLQQIALNWEVACAETYKILVATDISALTDSAKWTVVGTVIKGNGKTDTISFSPTNAKYIKMHGLKRKAGQTWGMSLYSLNAYSVPKCAGIANAGADLMVCKGKDVTITAKSGGATYAWNTGADSSAIVVAPTDRSVYTVTVTNSVGCSDADSVVVTMTLVRMSGFKSSTYCPGSSAVSLVGLPAGGTFSGSGITNTSFLAADAGAGEHVISYSVAGCLDSAKDTVIVVDVPETSIIGLKVKYALTEKADTITGVPSGGVFSGKGMSAGIFKPSLAGIGTHKISYVTDTAGCKDTAFVMVEVAATSGINDETHAILLSTYPNPAKDILQVHVQQSAAMTMQISISDMLGHVIQRQTSEKASTDMTMSFDTALLSNGIYFVQVRSGNAFSSRKFTVLR